MTCSLLPLADAPSPSPFLPISRLQPLFATINAAPYCLQQVVRLAQEVAVLQQQLAELAGVKRRQLDAELAALEAREQALAARRDAAQLGALKQELHALQLGGEAGSKRCSGGREQLAATAGGSDGNSGVPRAEPGGLYAAAAGAAGAATASPVKDNGGSQVLQGQLGEAVQRLLRERELLLDSGAYSSDDPLISQLDARIRECAALAQRGSASVGRP